MVHRHDGPDHSAGRSDDDAAKAAAEEVVAKIEQAEAAADKQEEAKADGEARGNGDAKDSADAKGDADTERTVTTSAPSDEIGDPHRLRHRRDWHHIPHTRIRTSTAIVSVLFIVCVVLYGYTSQRYGIVDAPAPQPTHQRTTVETTPQSTYSTPSSYPSTSEPSGVTGESGNPSEQPGEGGAAPGNQSGQPTTTGSNGFSDFFGRNNQQNQQETTAVPSR